MSETNTSTQDEKQETVMDDVKTPDGIPYSRFKEVNDELKSVKDQIAKMQSDKDDARKKDLEKQGEYKTLLEETNAKLEQAQIKADEWATFQADRRKTLIEKLPEEDRELYGGLELDKLETHVNKIQKTTVPATDSSAPGGTKGYTTVTDAARAFSRGEIDENAWQKIRRTFADKINR